MAAQVLAQNLGLLRLKLVGSKFLPRQSDLIINWGNSNWLGESRYINQPYAVQYACNKLETFKVLSRKDVSIPEWTTDTEVAQQWIDEETKVYGRKVLTGHSGNGIIIFDNETITTPQQCPLYTKATSAKHEYRVHIMKGHIIDFTQKKKREGYDGGIAGIRNSANGWVFCRNDVTLPETVGIAALVSVSALGLDFGAVDVGYRERDNKAFVYEVNTAPGLEGTSLQRYVTGFKELYNV